MPVPSKEDFARYGTWNGSRINDPNSYYDAFIKAGPGAYGSHGFNSDGSPVALNSSPMEEFSMMQYEEAKSMEAARQARISQGVSAINSQFAQFTPDFYDKQKDSYENWAQPQLDKQYSTAATKLKYALARAGLTNSSIGESKKDELLQMNADAVTKLGETGLGYATAARGQTDSAKQQLIAQLNATSGAENAASVMGQQALTDANRLQDYQPTYDTLGDFFYGLTPDIGQSIIGIGAGAQAGYAKSAGPSISGIGGSGASDETVI